MKNKLSLFIVLIFMLFSLTGCYDATTIETSYYIVAIGIDEGTSDLYNISIQIAKNESGSSNEGSSQSSTSEIYQIECKTFDTGISILNNYLNKTINLSHCSVIVFSEALARKGLGNLANSLATNEQLRPTAYVLISDKSAYDVLNNVANSGEKFSSRFYEYIINSVNHTAYSGKTSFYEFTSKLNSKLEDCVAIYAHIVDDTVQNGGLAVFKNDKMIGTTTVLDSISHLLLSNGLDESTITISNPLENNSYIDLEIKKEKNSKIDVSMINNTPFINCNIYINGTIKTSGEHFDYTSYENIKNVEYYTQKYLENIIIDYLYKISKEFNTDVLQFERIFSKKCLTNSELSSYKFDNVFKDSFFKVNVDFKIKSTHLFSKQK